MKPNPCLLLLVLLAVVPIACTQRVSYQLAPKFSKADSILCDRRGGGQLTFTIQRTQDLKELVFRVTKSNFADLDKSFTLASTDFDAATWQGLQDLFEGRTDLGGTISAETAPTGTWFDAHSIQGGVSLRIANPQVLELLSSQETRVNALLAKDAAPPAP